MIETYNDITGADTQRANDIILKIDNGETISAEDAEFYAQYSAAMAAIQIELQTRVDTMWHETDARIEEFRANEQTAREGYNRLVDAALARYERVRNAANE